MRRFSTIVSKGIRILPMPKLSPSMVSGTIEKWLIEPGTLTDPYQLIAEISTDSLLYVKESHKDILDIEIIEETYLARILVEKGRSVRVGSPIAVFCDDVGQINEAKAIEVMMLVLISCITLA